MKLDRPDRPDPFAQLERSHRRLEERLDELSAATVDPSPGAVDVARDVLGFFSRAVRRHESDEEESLFTRLRGDAALAPLLERLEREHREHEALHEQLGRVVDALERAPDDAAARRELATVADRLTRAYREHLQDEEAHLFPAARRALDDEAIAQIAAEMEARRAGGRGGGKRRDRQA